jgi:dUTP pyrophosphatase
MITELHVFVDIANGGRMPHKAHQFDAGVDLYVSQDALVAGGGFAEIRTAIYVAIPTGMWGLLTPRSSTWRTRGLIVMQGVIDSGYRGELISGVHNPTSTDYTVKKGDRIAQLILMGMPLPFVVEDMKLRDLPDAQDGRGKSGFGSTGG